MDVYGTFNEKSFVMTFLKSGEDNMEGFIAELLQQKNILSADYCFALWAGGSVPRKVQSQFNKQPEWKKESCAVLPVQGFPWKVGSKEEKRFVRLLSIKVIDIIQMLESSHTCCYVVLYLQIETAHQEFLRLTGRESRTNLTVEECEEVTVTIPYSDPPQVDVVKFVELLLISKLPTTEVSLASCYNSVLLFIISVMRGDHFLLYSLKNVYILLACTWCVLAYVCPACVYLHTCMYA